MRSPYGKRRTTPTAAPVAESPPIHYAWRMAPPRRSFVSLFLAVSILVVVATGVMLYLLKHSNATAAVHTSFALLFLGVVVFHIKNNLRALAGYAWKSGAARPWLRKELLLAIVPAALVLGGMVYRVRGFDAVYAFGNRIRNAQENKREGQVAYDYLQTKTGERGLTLELDVRKGKAFDYPLFAVWIEDMDGRFLETLYVSKAIGTSEFESGKKVGDKWVPAIVRRPEALPYWGHRRGIRADDGYYLPDPAHPIPDAISAATPSQSFRLETQVASSRPFRIYLEVNQSFDWNDYYSKNRFPDDRIYSGDGQSGQPSLVYAADIDPSFKGTRYFALNVVGHGHHSGQDGALDPDVSRLTTALEILDGVTVKLSTVGARAATAG